ncbi:hypothetical protein P1J78_17845 [Psychromarinibacter sp. C21-152]|uniref:Uncharacterized protein n=1 Tax=Psychromarinibacter sediminicola TaxID=3033385 RepID=A0AAE3TBE6_9RHOB|nr:hypothetical protein [Psychromarinibacter sediminicola]MDF0602605.1 hypothetical protein [Psychromarinibacter sediminicola]
MNRLEFIAITAIVLFVAFALGWFAHWLIHRFSRVKGSEMSELDKLAQQLHEAEDQRDQAVAYYQQRENDLTGTLHQTEAELSAAMEALRDTRQEAEELRAYIEKVNQSDAPAPAESAPVFTRR